MEKEREQPQWLIETQNNSWNPELLISGISILFIFAFSDRLNDSAIAIIQDYGVNPVLTLFSLMYVTLAVEALKYAFVLHLLMRGVWVGLVGLNYTFPQGIHTEKLPKMSQQPFFLNDLKDTIEIIMRVERICSSIFSIAFTIVGISAWIMLFLLPAILLSSFGVPLTWVFIGLGVLLVAVSVSLPIYNLLSQRLKVEVAVLRSIYLVASKLQYFLFFRESLLTFQTNMKNYKLAMVIFIAFFGLAGMQASAIIRPTMDFVKDISPEKSIIPGISNRRRARPYEQLHPTQYLDQMSDFQRLRKAAVPAFTHHENVLPVYSADYDWDYSATESDSSLQIHELCRVRIGETSYDAEWRRTYLPTNGQRVWVTHIDIASLPRGEHKLIVEKLMWHPYDKVVLRDNHWCEILFFVD